jgi:hypothetical protein
VTGSPTIAALLALESVVDLAAAATPTCNSLCIDVIAHRLSPYLPVFCHVKLGKEIVIRIIEV